MNPKSFFFRNRKTIGLVDSFSGKEKDLSWTFAGVDWGLILERVVEEVGGIKVGFNKAFLKEKATILCTATTIEREAIGLKIVSFFKIISIVGTINERVVSRIGTWKRQE